MLGDPRYAMLSALLACGMIALYVYSQVLGNLANVDVWVANLSDERAVLVLMFSILFGVTLTYQLKLWTGPRTCTIKRQAKGTGASGLSTIGIFLVSQCPACASLGALFLPLSAVTFLGAYAEWITAGSIVLLLFTLHYLGALEHEK